ncbi:DUF202 domain-containing protein [Flindersiella endophytica]
MSEQRADPDRIYETAAQLERTALSWNRTLLAVAANGVLLVRMGTSTSGNGVWMVAAGLVALLFTLLAWIVTSRTYRRLRGRPAVSLLAHPPYAHGAALFVGLVGLADLAAIAVYR